MYLLFKIDSYLIFDWNFVDEKADEDGAAFDVSSNEVVACIRLQRDAVSGGTRNKCALCHNKCYRLLSEDSTFSLNL